MEEEMSLPQSRRFNRTGGLKSAVSLVVVVVSPDERIEE